MYCHTGFPVFDEMLRISLMVSAGEMVFRGEQKKETKER